VLSKDNLISLWNISGDFLHRGTANQVLSKLGQTIPVDLDPIVEATNKIYRLLEYHIISFPDKRHLIGTLRDRQTGRASLRYGESTKA
jgi:hypothetical protein